MTQVPIGHGLEVLPTHPDGPVVGILPSGAGLLVAQPGTDRPTYLPRPTHELVTWRIACTCGSWSTALQRVATPADEDLATLRVYAADADVAEVPDRSDVLAAATATWDAGHLAGVRATAAVRETHRRVEAALLALDDAVAEARRSGATWDAIGKAVGITRQSAHARWAARRDGGRHRSTR